MHNSAINSKKNENRIGKFDRVHNFSYFGHMRIAELCMQKEHRGERNANHPQYTLLGGNQVSQTSRVALVNKRLFAVSHAQNIIPTLFISNSWLACASLGCTKFYNIRLQIILNLWFKVLSQCGFCAILVKVFIKSHSIARSEFCVESESNKLEAIFLNRQS